jgi:sigma-B regulation protein RsbU (phosphoserine phosphatase)
VILSSIVDDPVPQRGEPVPGVEEEHRLRLEAEAITRTLREGLLPAKLPEIPGAEVAGHFEPASAVEVGGDFYDCFAIESDRWLMVIADVTGKGPGAAAVASMVRYAARTAASQGQNPPQIAATVSRVIYLAREETDHRFATATVVELSAVADEFNVQVTVAGHPPALIATAGELADWLTVPGPMLGIEPDQRYRSRSSRLIPGDAVVLYTDGVSEARTSTGFVGVDGVGDTLLQHVAEPAGSIVAAITGLTSKAQKTDDVAVLVLKVLSSPRPGSRR